MAEAHAVAALPMYDWPELREANDALWAAIADRLRADGVTAPGTLDRGRDARAMWTDPGLLFGQTCAWPYVTRLREQVRLVATPIYDTDGCAGGLYSSFLIARSDESGVSLGAYAGRRFAVNAADSLSGHVALRSAMEGEGVSGSEVEWVETGSHRESVRAVADGRADVAAIDAVCWALAGRHEAEAFGRLKVLNRTPLRPGLPWITAGGTDDVTLAALRRAVFDAIADESTLEARKVLLLAGAEILDEADYLALANLGDHAAPPGLASSG